MARSNKAQARTRPKKKGAGGSRWNGREREGCDMAGFEFSRREILGGSIYVTVGAGATGAVPTTATAAEGLEKRPPSASTHDIVLRVNGSDRALKVESRADSRRSAARPARIDRDQDRLQPRRVLGLHRLARRRAGLLLHHPGGRGQPGATSRPSRAWRAETTCIRSRRRSSRMTRCSAASARRAWR